MHIKCFNQPQVYFQNKNLYKKCLCFIFRLFATQNYLTHVYVLAASARRRHRAFEFRTSVRPSEDQVKIFGQGRISRPINGRKLIFHLRIYLNESSRNIQES